MSSCNPNPCETYLFSQFDKLHKENVLVRHYALSFILHSFFFLMSASRQSWLQELSSQVKKYSVTMMRVTGDECIHTN